MKQRIFSISVGITAALLCCCIASAKAQILFKNPKVVFSAPEGANPGEFGRSEPKPEGEPVYPYDFTVDSNGNFWIQDDVNARIQKFNRNGKFILAWRPPEDGWRIRIGASLEADNQGNIYVVTENRAMEVLRGSKLDNQAKFVSHFQCEFGRFTELSLRVNSKGDISIFGDSRALFLNKEGTTVLSRGYVRRITTSAFSDYTLLHNYPEGGDPWGAFERYAQRPEKGISGLPVTFTKQGSRVGDLVAIDGQGNSFVNALDERKFSMEIYGSGGEYLGKIPECPKKTVPRPGDGDDFVVDGNGNLYQLQLFHPNWGPESAEGWVKIWKWERL